MSKEIARFQLTSGANNLERWVIPDNVNVITENTDSTHYSETYQHKFYNSAIINFDTSLYGYLWASSMLLFDASCQVTIERSTNGGSSWSSYRTTNFQTLRNSFYTSSGGDSGIGGTYWINLNSNDAQCISSVLPICNNATDFNNAVTNVYVPEIASGGAGSGYIGNSLVSNKKMVGYNVPTSSAESTKTESIEDASASPVSGKPKIGNGFAKIKLVREAKKLNLFDRFKTTDTTHYKQSSSGVSTYDFKVPNDMLQYAQTDWIIFWGARNKRMPTINSSLITFANTGGASESCVLIPLNSISDVVSFELSVRLSNIPYSNAYAHVGLMSYDAIDGFSFLADTDLVYIYGDNVPSVNEWFTFKKYFSGVRADYLAIMYLIDGQHEIKDLKVEYLN